MTAPDWLARVLAAGESVAAAPPDLAADRAAVLALLRRAFDRHALDVAGPPPEFDADAALAGAQLLAVACWRQAGGDTAPPLPAREPDSPAAHLSLDVCARLLPDVYRRALASGAPLAAELEAVLRRWPLAGVLADLDGAPIVRARLRALRAPVALRRAPEPRAAGRVAAAAGAGV